MGHGSSGSSISCRVPVTQARPETEGNDCAAAGEHGRLLDAAGELGADDRAGEIAVAHGHLAAHLQYRHARRTAGAGGRAVDLAGLDDDGIGACQHISLATDRERDLAEGDVVPLRVDRVGEAQLLVRRLGDADAGLGDVVRLVGHNGEP